MIRTAIADMQRRLQALRFDPGPADGIAGPRTAAALEAFLIQAGLPMRVTWTRDSLTATGPVSEAAEPGLPWIAAAMEVYGLHEARDNARLSAWLRRDGRTLGDPAALPWCGDYVETAIRIGLPGEPLPGPLGANPYLARNWLAFGGETPPTFGAVAVFSRPGAPHAGHVGFLVGQDDGAWHVLGGNQGDAVTVTRIVRQRLLGCRWPATFARRPVRLPMRDPGNMNLSANEL